MIVIFALVVLFLVLKVVQSIWWKPRSLERKLRQQGFRGTSYKLIWGDLKESLRLTQEAASKSMPLKHQVPQRIYPFMQKMVQEYGKVSIRWFKTAPRIQVADAELVRLILADKNGHFMKPPFNRLVNILQMGVSTLDGEKWSTRRKLITPAFHMEKLKKMMPAFSASCIEMIEQWTEIVSTQENYELDILPEFQSLAGDVIARTAFGSSYKEGIRIFELQKEQAALVFEAFYGLYFPGYRFLPTKKNKRRYAIDDEVKSKIRGMIQKKEQQMMEGNTYSEDLLSLLLQLRKQPDSGMTTEDVIEECKLFYFAGQETTAHLLTWTMIVLSMHPEWQEKAREEVLNVCGKKIPDIETLNRLKLVTMILHEVLRLYPPVTALFRHTQQTTRIGGMSVPAGVDIVLPVLLLHYDPQYWGDDVEEFKPIRFSEGVSKASKDQIAFYPFGWGPRICLGQNFALIETRLALALIFQRFTFELSPSYTHAPRLMITLQPQYGAPIILRRT